MMVIMEKIVNPLTPKLKVKENLIDKQTVQAKDIMNRSNNKITIDDSKKKLTNALKKEIKKKKKDAKKKGILFIDPTVSTYSYIYDSSKFTIMSN